ncbi:blastoderm specific protein 25d [Culex quinquefasciatus]|uniref:Blastoderm specific protein 25d n=1 Tax=Culex quinquefasciatus TaxID=7176 RepID=B0WBN3_CULQU|nr:blastoderm specific protein 25d [Culex quinquefasciatus]|eukprot:XP_001846117.1 blastoderm specific protein 25d [Culex quinquefasciatus]
MALSSDPYEQRLFQMFQAHDVDSCGRLDREALVKLCHTLELKERGHLLVRCLLGENSKNQQQQQKQQRITFKEFREGLLHILGGEEQQRGGEGLPVPSGEDELGTSSSTPVTTTPSKLIINTTDNDNEESSDREVSPKFVVGTKKYGRRSRPRQDCNGFDTSSDFSNSDNESVPLPGDAPQEPTEEASSTTAGGKSSSKVQRSASQSDIHGSKRRRPPMGGSRLKRCASLPTHRQRPADFKNRDSVEETVGFTMRMPADWSAAAADIGSLAASIIADMWESAGIAEPRQLLHEMGFYGEELQVADLVAALDDEQQRLGDGSDTSVVMRASLALHKAEVAALRQAFVQLVEENKKLYSDNKEVNHRATLLAQEVDERHNSLENSTRAKIRLLEQRHHETVKELTSQLAYEREQLSCSNAVLEKRIQALEAEDGKSKTEMGRLSEENDGLRTEQENLVKELTELLEKNIKLNKDIAELEENNRNDLDDGFDRKDDLEVLELIEKISILQDENTQLRDKNDEFTAEIESLNLELAKFKLKRSGISRTSSLEASPGVASADGGVGEESSSAARKRQGDSPSKARLSDESPRLGKFRKCSNELMENESDSSGDWMALQSELGMRVDSGITSSGISQDYSIVSESSGKEEEIRLLKGRVAELEKKLEEKKTPSDESATEASEESDSTAKKTTVDPVKIKARCDELEASMEQLSKEYEACEDYWQSKLNEERQLYEEEQRIADDKFNELLKKMAEYEEQFAGQAGGGGSSSKSEDGRLSPIEEKDVLEQQYLDLEAEFQQAQQMLEEKSHEVDKFRCRILELEQLVKYPSEAMLATPPRIETPEMEESPASSPISYLWNQSTIQAPATTTTRDYQNPNWCQPLKVSTGTTTPTQQQCDDPAKDQLTVQEEEPGFSRTISPIQKPASSVTGANSTTDVTSCGGDAGQDVGDCSDVCSVKSARSTHSLASTHSIHKSVSQTDVAMVSQEQLKHQRLMQLQLQDEIKELTHQRDCLKMEFQQMTEVKPFLARSYNKTAHPNLTQKIQHLENKNRHLNGMLKQQQAYSEQILHRIWQHQRSEIAEMSNRLEAQSIVIADQAKRLASNDILVKDLYVENTHLAAQVQRLEQQKVRATLLQQYTQAATSGGGHHPHPQLSGIVPGMP